MGSSNTSLLFLAFVGVLFLASCAAAKDEDCPAPSHVNTGCVVSHCMGQYMKARGDPQFKALTACEDGCNPFWCNDTTPDKIHYQNCTTKCALTYENQKTDDFMACSMNHKCVTFDPIDMTCPKPTPGTETSLADLRGEWWQHYGYNKLWDAYPCQHIHKMEMVNDEAFCAQTVSDKGPVKAPCWSYTYSYNLFTETGTKYFEQTWQLPGDVPKGEPIDLFYMYMGTTHDETWYILDSVKDRYVVLVDCSYMSGWTNVGSIIWVRPDVVLTNQEMDRIAAVYKEKMGWNFPEDFVVDRHGADNCDEPSTF